MRGFFSRTCLSSGGHLVKQGFDLARTPYFFAHAEAASQSLLGTCVHDRRTLSCPNRHSKDDLTHRDPAPQLQGLELPIEELTAIIQRAQVGPISVSESAKLQALVETFLLQRAE